MQPATQTYTEIAAKNRRDELILAHLALVRHIIGKMVAQLPHGVDIENIESAGTLGLVEAAAHYDAERGVEFKSYAYSRIRGAVLDELRRNCPLPQHMLERVALVRRAHAELQPPVTLEALVTATGLSSEEVTDCLAAIRMTRMVSWDGASEPVGIRLDESQERPDSRIEREEQKNLLAEAIMALPERERLTVTLYYMEDLRLKEIGKLLGLSESRVSRVLNAALFRLGEAMRLKER